MTGTPAFVLNGRLDIVTANALGLALYAPIYADPVRPPNNARFIFLHPHANVSSATGIRPPTTPWPCCVPRQDAIPTTGTSRT
jgi:hypothetical protein